MEESLCSEGEALIAAERLAEEYDLLGECHRAEVERMMVETYALLGKGFHPTPADIDSCISSLTLGTSRVVC
jgi:hypothetical protein